jgi:cytochrome c553
MRTAWFLAAAVALPAVAAVPEQPWAPGIESEEYRWEEPTEELTAALQLEGDPAAGRIAYEVCQGCHRPDGSGRPDGTYPQLAGQHATVLMKQMADIRAGRRENQAMYPFAGDHLIELHEIPDIAVYLQGLPIPTDNGKGPGTEIGYGRQLYERDCKSCHGDHGEGNAEKFYPVLAGQHYDYMLRQTEEIKDGQRRNANEKMVKVLQDYTSRDMQAVVDYMSRLRLPERGAESGAR